MSQAPKKSYIAGPSNAQGKILSKSFMDVIVCKSGYIGIPL